MPRRLKLSTAEMGEVELYLIYDVGGTWEETWQPLQGVMDIPSVAKETMDHALRGWTRPLVDNLGPPPKGMLRKLSKQAQRCAHEDPCPFYMPRRCGVLFSKMPWCFEPDGIVPGSLAADIIKLWRQEVYVVTVQEPCPDA